MRQRRDEREREVEENVTAVDENGRRSSLRRSGFRNVTTGSSEHTTMPTASQQLLRLNFYGSLAVENIQTDEHHETGIGRRKIEQWARTSPQNRDVVVLEMGYTTSEILPNLFRF